jgi:hypothetical protein
VIRHKARLVVKGYAQG